jgi:hypothetical protein
MRIVVKLSKVLYSPLFTRYLTSANYNSPRAHSSAAMLDHETSEGPVTFLKVEVDMCCNKLGPRCSYMVRRGQLQCSCRPWEHQTSPHDRRYRKNHCSREIRSIEQVVTQVERHMRPLLCVTTLLDAWSVAEYECSHPCFIAYNPHSMYAIVIVSPKTFSTSFVIAVFGSILAVSLPESCRCNA